MKEKILKLLGVVLQAMIVVVLVLLAGYWGGRRLGLIEEIRIFSVVSGSMEPAVKTGDSVMVIKNDFGYPVGEVVTYKTGDRWVTHRVVRLVEQNGSVGYVTKGDGNENEDLGIISAEQIRGRVMGTIPYLGYLGIRLKDPRWFIVLVIVPATVIIYEELKKIRKELNNWVFLRKLKKKDNCVDNNTKEDNFRSGWWAMLTVAVGGVMAASVSGAWFVDIEASNGNGVTAGTFGSHIPNLLLNEILTHPHTGDKEWVEIYNPSDQDVSLNDWKIQDNGPNHTANLGGTIIGHGFHVLEVTDWFNDSGDAVHLINPDGIEVEIHSYSSMPTDKSHGKNPDGTGAWVTPTCGQTSKGESNNEKC